MAGAERSLVVYVVERDAAVRDGLARLMRSAGYRATACASEEELIAQADSASPGCVLLDLPSGAGSPESLDVRLHALGLDFPLIALSLSGDERADRAARAAGARFLLRKPVDDRALLDAIRWTTGGRAGPADARR